jgi:hypothetical protein
MLTYLACQLCAFNRDDRPPPPQRHLRKAILRYHPSRFQHGGGTRRCSRDGNSGSPCNRLSFGLLNTRSVSVANRSTAISDVITSRRRDELALTETWHRAFTDVSLKRCAPTGYSIIDVARPTRGGGVALLFDSRFTAKRLTFPVQPTTIEVVSCLLSFAST